MPDRIPAFSSKSMPTALEARLSGITSAYIDGVLMYPNGVTKGAGDDGWSMSEDPYDGFIKSNRILSAIRRLDLGKDSAAILVQGDSTGEGTSRWVYQLGQALAEKYKAYTVKYSPWNDTTQQYDQATYLSEGSAGLRHVLTGDASTSWYMSIADSASTSPTGDLDVRIKVDLNGLSTFTIAPFCGKYSSAGSRSWRFEVRADGKLGFRYSVDGTAETLRQSSVALSGSQLTSAIFLRATIDVDNGASGNDVKFYTSSDGATWTQLGTTVTNSGTTSIFDSSIATQFIGAGGTSFPQQTSPIRFYSMQVFASLDGSARIIDIDAGLLKDRTSATSGTFIDNNGNTVTVTYNANGSLVGSPLLEIYNASTAGAAITYSSDAGRFTSQSVGKPNVCFVNYGHNASAINDYRSDYKALTDLLVAKFPDAPIICVLQNPKLQGAANKIEHDIRVQQISEFASSQGFDVLDVYGRWSDALTDAGLVHPTAYGVEVWTKLAARMLGIEQ